MKPLICFARNPVPKVCQCIFTYINTGTASPVQMPLTDRCTADTSTTLEKRASLMQLRRCSGASAKGRMFILLFLKFKAGYKMWKELGGLNKHLILSSLQTTELPPIPEKCYISERADIGRINLRTGLGYEGHHTMRHWHIELDWAINSYMFVFKKSLGSFFTSVLKYPAFHMNRRDWEREREVYMNLISIASLSCGVDSSLFLRCLFHTNSTSKGLLISYCYFRVILTEGRNAFLYVKSIGTLRPWASWTPSVYAFI